jgi:dTMP kinase
MSEDILSKEDINRIKQDVEDTKRTLADKDKESAVAKAREEARKEAEKEFDLKQKLETQEKARLELEAKLKAQEESQAKAQEDFKRQIDDLKTSKTNVTTQDPFSNPSSLKASQISPEQVRAIEEASKELFLSERSK